jgi:hypothetical protein
MTRRPVHPHVGLQAALVALAQGCQCHACQQLRARVLRAGRPS